MRPIIWLAPAVAMLALSACAPTTSNLTAATNGAPIAMGLVKAAFIDAKDLQVNSIKVVTERGIVYLMGRVTAREAKRASDIVRGISGVTKVVRVFDEISEEELQRLSQSARAK